MDLYLCKTVKDHYSKSFISHSLFSPILLLCSHGHDFHPSRHVKAVCFEWVTGIWSPFNPCLLVKISTVSVCHIDVLSEETTEREQKAFHESSSTICLLILTLYWTLESLFPSFLFMLRYIHTVMSILRQKQRKQTIWEKEKQNIATPTISNFLIIKGKGLINFLTGSLGSSQNVMMTRTRVRKMWSKLWLSQSLQREVKASYRDKSFPGDVGHRALGVVLLVWPRAGSLQGRKRGLFKSQINPCC